MAVIDIGPPAINRGSTFTSAKTAVLLDNPANDTGVITKNELWFVIAGSGVKAGTFYGSGTDYTSRDYETIGNVPSGSKQTFTGLDCDVSSGDFIGIYFSGGIIESDFSGYAGLYVKGGDQFGAGEQTYALWAGDTASIYGEGETEEGETYVKTVAIDTLLRAVDVESVNLDAYIRSQDVESVNLDTLIRVLGLTKTSILDAILVGRDVESVNLDAFVKALGLTKSTALDVLLGTGETIDIGAPAIDRNSDAICGNTHIMLDNPANASGEIIKIELWFATAASGVKAGTFYGSGTSYTNRDYETIGAVSSGSKQTFSGLSCSVGAGDYIGIYAEAGNIEESTTGFAGRYYKSGDQFGTGQQTYILVASRTCSAYGEGTGALTYVETVAVDALLRAADAETINLDVFIKAFESTETAALEALLIGRDVESIPIDILVKALGLTKTAALDVLLGTGGIAAVDLDVLIEALGITETVAVDAFVAGRESESVDLSALIKALGLEAISLDILLEALGVTKEAALDVILSGSGLEEIALDALIIAVEAEAVTLDVLIVYRLGLAPRFTLEVRDAAGNLIARLENAFDVSPSEAISEPGRLRFSLPRDDPKWAELQYGRELWLYRNSELFEIYKVASLGEARR